MIKNQDFLKKENQNLVLKLIIDRGPISRAEIAKKTKMSPTSASRIVGVLLQHRLIREVEAKTDNVGRKATYFVPNESAVISAGIEINKRVVRIGFLNFVGELIAIQSYNFVPVDPYTTVGFAVDKLLELMKRKDIPSEKLAGVCVGLPGLIENDKGNVKLSAQFDWKEVPLAEMMRSKIDVPIHIDNELKLQALAEYNTDNSSNQENMVMISFGSGVGSAVISKGEIYRGKDNFAGEIGHTIVDPMGIYCPCGNFGCLQTYIAEQFLLNEASKTKKLDSIGELISETKKGEKWANNILDKATTYAAITINNVICLNNAHTVVLTGSLIVDHPEFREEVFKKYKKQIWSPAVDNFRLTTTKLGTEGVVIGAALSVQRNYLKEIHLDEEISV